MARITQLSEVEQMEDGEVIYVIRGKIKALYKIKSGETDNKAWSFQDLVLTDGKAEAKVTLKDRDELPQSYRGKSIVILANHGERGWTGVKSKYDDYKKKIVVWVTGSAEIVDGASFDSQNRNQPPPDGAGAAAPPPRASAPASAPQSHASAPAASAQRLSGKLGDIMAVRMGLGRAANLMLLSLDAAMHVAKQYGEKHQVTMTDHQFTSIATTFYISGERNGFAGLLPSGKLPDLKQQPPAPAAPRQSEPPPAPPPPPPPPPEEPQDDVPF